MEANYKIWRKNLSKNMQKNDDKNFEIWSKIFEVKE